MRYVIGVIILIILILIVARIFGGGSPSAITTSAPGYTVTTSSGSMGQQSYQPQYSSQSSQGSYSSVKKTLYVYQQPQQNYPDYQPNYYPNYQPAYYPQQPVCPAWGCNPMPYPVTTNTSISPAAGFCNDACSCNYCSPELRYRQQYGCCW